MKFPFFLAAFIVCAYGEVVVTPQAPTAQVVLPVPVPASAIIPNDPAKSNLTQEIVIGNKEPIDVKVTNFEPIGIQKVQLDRNDTINVVVTNELKMVEKKRSRLLMLHESIDIMTVENGVYLGGLNTDTQNIFIYKTHIKNSNGHQSGMIVKFIADSKLEISKDIKILVENELYIDADEIPALQEALAKMLSTASEPNETKDYRIVFNFLDDAQISIYSIKKMLSSSKGAEASFVIGKDEKYISKTLMSPKELMEFKSIVDKFASTTVESI
jgi:hypothetical protein